MILNYDPGMYRRELLDKGYVLLRGLLSDDFVKYLTAFCDRALADANRELVDWKITGKKRQYVFDFPTEEASREFRAGLARLTGLDASKITISERHLKVYEPDTNPWPAPHKDRAASQYSIGLPVRLPSGSTVCVFPHLFPGPNPHERAVFLTEDDCPELGEIYQNGQAVRIHENVGDVIVFHGSALFHERACAAETAIVYIKINDDGRDPLGENLFVAAKEPA